MWKTVKCTLSLEVYQQSSSMLISVHNSSWHHSSTISEVAKLLSSMTFFGGLTLPGSIVKCCSDRQYFFYLQWLILTIFETLLTLSSIVLWTKIQGKGRLDIRPHGAISSPAFDGEFNSLRTLRWHHFSLFLCFGLGDEPHSLLFCFSCCLATCSQSLWVRLAQICLYRKSSSGNSLRSHSPSAVLSDLCFRHKNRWSLGT